MSSKVSSDALVMGYQRFPSEGVFCLLRLFDAERMVEKMGVGKYFTVIFLGILCVATIFSGLWFTGYSISNHNSLLVLGNKMPGFLFGFAVVYIGVRSFIRLLRLSNQLKKPNVVFSWHNFIK